MDSYQLQEDVVAKHDLKPEAVETTNDRIISRRKQGGWTTSPFILGSLFALTMAAGGSTGNLIVYLITEYNVKSIDATQVNNVVNGCLSFFPVVVAIIYDSFFGSFPVIALFSFISFLGVTLLTLSASLRSLRPQTCSNISLPCEFPSTLHLGVLYTACGLVSIGIGGTRFTIATMGADQFEDSNDRGIYFNWYFFFLYTASLVSLTAIIYIQDNVSWALGYGICAASSGIGLLLFLSGKRFYRQIKPEGSPFTSIARVIISAARKQKVLTGSPEYNYDSTQEPRIAPSNTFRFLNHGAIKTESDGSNSRSWSLCTVQEVEDLKALMRIVPLWSTGILLSILIAMSTNFTILQALTMDRRLGGSHFKIPAGSFIIFNTLATVVSISVLDRLIFPLWQNLTGRVLTPLQRIGAGHVINVVALVSYALIETQRLHAVQAHHLMGPPVSTDTVVPISALWLVVPLTIVGIGEACQFPGQVLLYYQEFPISLRTTSTAMISLLVAIGFYLSIAVTGLIRKSTKWLPNNINDGRLDKVYWMLAVIGVVNFGYYLVCAKMFKHQKMEKHGGNLKTTSNS